MSQHYSTLHVLLLVSNATYPQHSLSITRCLLEHVKQQQGTYQT